MKAINKLFDAIFVTRPVLLIPVWAYFIFGYYRASLLFGLDSGIKKINLPGTGHSVPLVASVSPRTVLMVLGFSLLLSAIYIINQIGDIEVDKKNRGLPLLAKGIVSGRMAWIEAGFLSVISFCFAFWAGSPAPLLFLVAIVIGVLYSLPPFKWSGRPILDFLSNAVGYGCITFFLGWTAAVDAGPSRMIQMSVPYFLFMVAGSLASTIPDMPGDLAEGKSTTAVWLGIRGAGILGLLSMLGALAAGFLNRDLLCVIIAIVSLPAFARLVMRPQIRNSYAAYQIGGGLFVLVSLLVFPAFFLLSCLIYISTRIYFRLRHGIKYPSIGS